jgi:hypothetical protein
MRQWQVAVSRQQTNGRVFADDLVALRPIWPFEKPVNVPYFG